MKRVLYGDISPTARQPFTQVTHKFYGDALYEVVNSICKLLTKRNDTDVFYLWGISNIAAFPAVDLPAGAVYFNGEIYQSDPFSTISLSDTVVGTFTTVYDISDPLPFTDGNTHNVHQIKKVVWSDAASGSGDFDLTDMKQLNLFDITSAQAAILQTVTTNSVLGGIEAIKVWSSLALTDISLSAYDSLGAIIGAAQTPKTGSFFKYLKLNRTVMVNFELIFDGSTSSVNGGVTSVTLALASFLTTNSAAYSQAEIYTNGSNSKFDRLIKEANNGVFTVGVAGQNNVGTTSTTMKVRGVLTFDGF